MLILEWLGIEVVPVTPINPWSMAAGKCLS